VITALGSLSGDVRVLVFDGDLPSPLSLDAARQLCGGVTRVAKVSCGSGCVSPLPKLIARKRSLNSAVRKRPVGSAYFRPIQDSRTDI